MAGKKKILLQLDTDPLASVFDSVVAVDSGADVLWTYPSMTAEQVESVVHGAIFTRAITDLKSTAIFVGGSSIARAEEVFRKAVNTFLGPMRVSIMLDANGCNTTAVAAVRAVESHRSLAGKTIAVLAATGAVGRRISQLLLKRGASVLVVSRDEQRARQTVEQLEVPSGVLAKPIGLNRIASIAEVLSHCQGVFSAGAAGIQLVSRSDWENAAELEFLVDLNAVPPLGIEGIEVQDFARQHKTAVCFGAVGVGELKMKIHRRCIAGLFEQNDLVLDLAEIDRLAETL